MAKEPVIKVLLSRIWASKKLRVALLLVLGVVFVLFALRGCGRHKVEPNHVYKIARTTIYPSIDVKGKEANLQAFLDELLLAIAKEEHIKFSLVTLNYGDLFNSLNNETYDAILTTVSMNKIVQDRYYISDPIYVGGPVLVTLIDSNVTESQDLSSMTIGINKNSPHIFQINQKYGIRLIPYTDTVTAIEQMRDGNISAVVMEAPIAYAFTRGFYAGKIKVVSRPLTDEAIRLITKDNDLGKNLIESFDIGLDKFLKDGTYQRLIQKWGLVTP